MCIPHKISTQEQHDLVVRLFAIAEDVAVRQDKKLRGHWVCSWLEELQHCPGYANKSEGDESIQLVILGDWNPVSVPVRDAEGRTLRHEARSFLPEKIERMLKRYGVGVEWGDEWAVCNECNKAVQTNPDHAWWVPKYKVLDGELLCLGCLEEKIASEQEEVEGLDEESSTSECLDG